MDTFKLSSTNQARAITSISNISHIKSGFYRSTKNCPHTFETDFSDGKEFILSHVLFVDNDSEKDRSDEVLTVPLQ